MRYGFKALLIGTTSLVGVGNVHAQSVPAGSQTDPTTAVTETNAARAINNEALGDIVVTARREAENVQRVPVSIQVVTGDTIQKLALLQSTELSKIAPGLNINQSSGDPNNLDIVLRGVRWNAASGTPAIPTYLNEVSFDPREVLTTLYDIGQIEALRGPQGTTRGAPSIAGAITYTTHRPDLNEFGGYGFGYLGTHDHQNIQGAINIPIIADKLAIRLAGSYEHSQGSRVRSIFVNQDPRYRSLSGRASLRFEPNDTLSLNVMYQYLQRKQEFFFSVAGPGSPGFAALGIPANFNSPALAFDAYRSVNERPSFSDSNTHLVTANLAWEVFGQRLSYNFGLQATPGQGANAQDVANVLPGFDYLPTGGTPGGGYRVHELRLSSIRGEHPFWDYDLGFYRQVSDATLPFGTPAFLPGAFGAPFVTPPGQVTTPISRYVLQAQSTFRLKTDNYSFYGNLQLHLPYDFELSGGLRVIHDKRPVRLQVDTSASFVTFPRFLPAAFGGCPSPFLPNSPIYGPNYCDVAIPASSSVDNPGGKTYSPVIYNASLSHNFSDTLLAYGTVGSSFRQGLPSINNTGLPSAFVNPDPERATSYEIGVKSTPARWLRVNADIFQIDYKGQLTQFQGIPYYSPISQSVNQTSIAFFRNVDARVRGVEAELHINPTRSVSLNANLSYAKITSRGGQVPCDLQSTNPVSAANPINLCPSPKGQTLNPTSPFQASVNGSYEVPIGPVSGYFRFNVSHQGHNPAFGVSDPVFRADAYQIVDLYAGVTGGAGAWDLGVFAKNVFNEKQLLTRTSLLNTVYALYAAPTGLSQTSLTLPREVGVTLRYSFGSR